MARQKTGDKLGDIRRATILEVVERGSSAVSINNIAKRAGLSVGTVYQYHENKNHLLRQTYLDVKETLHAQMIASVSDRMDVCTKLKSMWFAILGFAYEQPNAFLFAEVVMNDLVLTNAERQQLDNMAHEERYIIEEAIADGVICDLNTDAIVTLLVAPALQLGRAAAMSPTAPDQSHAEDVFNLCWRAIAV